MTPESGETARHSQYWNMETSLGVQKISSRGMSPDVERWDDDDFENFDDVHLRATSTATSVVSVPQTQHRDSISSRMSLRSDSNHGDENWDVLVDEQASVKDAIALARSKGIPLPANVPRSALEGGTIRRLRGREIKKAIADDWSEDLDFTNAPNQLRLVKADDRDLSESLRQISAAFHSSPTSPGAKDSFDTIRSVKSRPSPTPISLDSFKDDDNDDDGNGDDDDDFADVPTIRVAKHRSPRHADLFTSPTQMRTSRPGLESMEEDLELPADGQLRLSTRKQLPRTPQMIADDFDMEWAEGSLGTRNAGRRGGVMSNRSSSVSALSPSASSAFTAESEDEGLDGLLLPTGPLKFEEILKRKQQDRSPEMMSQHFPITKRKVSEDKDWSEDIVIPDGDVFDAAKLTLNRNVKHKAQRPQSPGKRTTTTLNFTSNKQQATLTRLPRFQSAQERHDRARSNLEPVSESGAAVQRYQRPGSRMGHAAHSSVSAIPAPTTPAPSTPSRRHLRSAESRPDMRYDAPTTTNAQLLRAKRSMPVIRNVHSPTTKPTQPFNRPPSRQDGTSSRLNTSRPKTPTERSESRLGLDRRGGVPFLPAGASSSQSQHISMKTTATRHTRRNDSEGSNESMSAAQRSLSRLAGIRPETPGKIKPGYTAAELAAQAKKTMTKPARKRNFGDGSELEVFDDLPTSAATESRYVKQPVGRGAPKSLRSRLGQSQLNSSTATLVPARTGNESPLPTTPVSPFRPDFQMTSTIAGVTENPTNRSSVPRFARDTAASRNAREQRQISATFQSVRGEPLQAISGNWKPPTSLRPTGSIRVKKRNIQQKPHLIKPMGNDLNRAKEEKGMNYNPVLFRWEGNENALVPFDVPEFNPRDQSPILQGDHQANHHHPHHHHHHHNATAAATASTTNTNSGRGSPNNKSNMALIMNVGGNTNGVQVVGGMVFDPRQMRWLKIAKGGSAELRGGSGSVQLEEEEDVFASIEDLKAEDDVMSVAAGPRVERQEIVTPDAFDIDPGHDVTVPDIGNTSGNSGDEWPGVAEEFDVGPAFIKRQRDEEDRWRRKVEKWLRSDLETAHEEIEGSGGWRWGIRDLVCQGMTSEELSGTA